MWTNDLSRKATPSCAKKVSHQRFADQRIDSGMELSIFIYNIYIYFQENHAFRQFYKQRQENPNTIDPGLLDYMQKDFQKEINPPPEKLCTRQIQLKGPISPLETNIAAMIEGAITSAASIDPGSVNSVLLNNEPQEHTRKFMVAASVSKRNADELVARHTTLMPCIRGFASLMALIFCPTMEIKRDEPSNRYTSIITGLGFDKERPGPYLEEHDMKMDLDVEITEDDIDKVNINWL